LPVLNTVFLDINQPKRGDIAVFHFPPNPKIDYIKRIIGLPGDRIQYQNKRLVINDLPVEVTMLENSDIALQDGSMIKTHRLQEQLAGVTHDILVHDIPNRYEPNSIGDRFLNGESIVVPDGHYFAMGDNRDNSSDGRVWGFVPDKNLVGKAFFIWFNFDKFSRIGSSIH
jgi:signal peptidase I